MSGLGCRYLSILETIESTFKRAGSTQSPLFPAVWHEGKKSGKTVKGFAFSLNLLEDRARGKVQP